MRAATDPTTPFERFLERVEPATDRLNPILVKEVRQVLRARGFAWSYFALVMLAAVIGTFIVLGDERNPSDQLGQYFLNLLQILLAVGLLVVVPLQAFQSLGAEWEGETYDQLALSGLRPRNIVSGKLASAFVQTLLMVAAFAPFVALSFLMRGVDLVALGMVLWHLVLFSAWASALALGLSSLTPHRLARVVLFVALAGGLTLGLIGTSQFGWFLLADPAQIRDPQFQTVMVTLYIGGTAIAVFCHLAACGRLAHPEENASTPLRLFTVAASVLIVLWLLAARAWWGLPPFAVEGVTWMVSIGVMLFGVLWSTERQRLGRRVAHGLSLAHGRARFAPAVLLPGGGRGFVFMLLHLAALAVFVAVISNDGSSNVGSRRWFVVWVLCVASFFVGVPTAVLKRLSERETGIWVGRLSVLLFLGACVLLPGVVGLMLGDRSLMALEHPLNPFWVLVEAGDGDLEIEVAVTVVVLGLVGLAVNAPRVLAGLAEVRRARSGSYAEDDPAVARSRELSLAADRAEGAGTGAASTAESS